MRRKIKWVAFTKIHDWESFTVLHPIFFVVSTLDYGFAQIQRNVQFHGAIKLSWDNQTWPCKTGTWRSIMAMYFCKGTWYWRIEFINFLSCSVKWKGLTGNDSNNQIKKISNSEPTIYITWSSWVETTGGRRPHK